MRLAGPRRWDCILYQASAAPTTDVNYSDEPKVPKVVRITNLVREGKPLCVYICYFWLRLTPQQSRFESPTSILIRGMEPQPASSVTESVVSCDESEAAQHQDSDDGEPDFRPPARAATGLVATPVIQNFLLREFHQEHWEACAKRAKKLLEERLEGARDANEVEILASVTCRAKTAKSLEEKLKTRNQERADKDEAEYESGSEILGDIKDLAGVRVILYTPNKAQRDKVKELIKEIWKRVEEKPHGEPVSAATIKANEKRGIYTKKHLGYQAEHYRAIMEEKHGKGTYTWKDVDKVEIQVVSALGHAWAQAGHDVFYKTHAYGRPTIEEHRVLDALSGLITSGDLLLEQFQESVTRRTVAKWEHAEPFVIFLRDCDVLEEAAPSDSTDSRPRRWNHFSPAGIDVLYRLLVRVEKNYPLAVRNTLRDLCYPDDPDIGLQTELNRYEPALEAKASDGLLTPLCIISKLRPDFKTAKRPTQNLTVVDQCKVMIEALLSLQLFAGGPKNAKSFLLRLQPGMSESEEAGLNFVLSSPHRQTCFTSPASSIPTDWMLDEVRSAWSWFSRQKENPRSLCGLFFELASMGIPATMIGEQERLKRLTINSLSRANTLEDRR
jgi:ppGpp synthetase/RelA/SpoT-type nucleotidyltranferase